MPLDGHSYLVAQGWGGKGTGLRQGAISRPLAIPRKKNLAGLGKDRDEAFPFWDHLFSAAAKSIQLKVTSSDDDNSDAEPSVPELKRTVTGILSNRRPVTGLSASTSGTTTPDETPRSRSILLSIAKREAAKRGLYARFFRGPVLGPDDAISQAPVISESMTPKEVKENAKEEEDTGWEAKTCSKKRKRGGEDDAERRQRRKEKGGKNQRNSHKAQEKESETAQRREKKAAKEAGEKLRSEGSERKEKKRRRRALESKERATEEVGISTLEKKKKKKKDKDKAKELVLPDVGGPAQLEGSDGDAGPPREGQPQERTQRKKRKRTED